MYHCEARDGNVLTCDTTACMRALALRLSTQGRASDVTRAPLVCAAERSQDKHTPRQTLDKTFNDFRSVESDLPDVSLLSVGSGRPGFG